MDNEEKILHLLEALDKKIDRQEKRLDEMEKLLEKVNRCTESSKDELIELSAHTIPGLQFLTSGQFSLLKVMGNRDQAETDRLRRKISELNAEAILLSERLSALEKAQ